MVPVVATAQRRWMGAALIDEISGIGRAVAGEGIRRLVAEHGDARSVAAVEECFPGQHVADGTALGLRGGGCLGGQMLIVVDSPVMAEGV